jgi:hypothetical protein
MYRTVHPGDVTRLTSQHPLGAPVSEVISQETDSFALLTPVLRP